VIGISGFQVDKYSLLPLPIKVGMIKKYKNINVEQVPIQFLWVFIKLFDQQ
jgi:hypothetical protein